MSPVTGRINHVARRKSPRRLGVSAFTLSGFAMMFWFRDRFLFLLKWKGGNVPFYWFHYCYLSYWFELSSAFDEGNRCFWWWKLVFEKKKIEDWEGFPRKANSVIFSKKFAPPQKFSKFHQWWIYFARGSRRQKFLEVLIHIRAVSK